MPVPNIYEDTGATHGTGALSVPWGTHNDTFTAVLVVTCAGDGTLGTPTQSGADGTWTLIATCAEGSGAGSIQIAAYWCRATTGSMSNVDVPDTGDHTSAKMFMLQNVVATGNPINIASTQTVSSATASISMSAGTTTVANCLVFCLAGCAFDQSTSPGGSGWANAGLDTIGFGGQYCTDNGSGGGYMGGVGEKAAAGSCGTFTHTWASGATKQANIVFAISDTATTASAPEITPPVFPSRIARKVLATAAMMSCLAAAPVLVPPVPELSWQPSYPDRIPAKARGVNIGGHVGPVEPPAVVTVPELAWSPTYPDFAARGRARNMSAYSGMWGTRFIAQPAVPITASYFSVNNGGTTTDNAAATITISTSVAAGQQIIVFATATGNANAAPTCVDDQPGGQYDLVSTALWASSANNSAVWVRRNPLASGATHVLTITFGTHTAVQACAIRVTGLKRSGLDAIRQTASQANRTTGTTGAPVFGLNALFDNMTLVALHSDDSTTTPPTGWTEHSESGQATPTCRIEVASRIFGFTGTTITFGASTTGNYATHSIELDGTAGAVIDNNWDAHYEDFARAPKRPVNTGGCFAPTGEPIPDPALPELSWVPTYPDFARRGHRPTYLTPCGGTLTYLHPLRLGVHSSESLEYGAANSGYAETTPAVNTQVTGSCFVVSVGRHNGLGAPTGTINGASDGNTYTQEGSNFVFGSFPDYNTALYLSATPDGGDVHRWRQPGVANFDEAAIMAVEVIGGFHIQDTAQSEEAAASTITSPSVTTTAEAILISFLWGTGADTAEDMSATVSDGWTIIEAQVRMFGGNGAFSCWTAYKYVSTAGVQTGCPWQARMGVGQATAQGGQLYTVAVQALEVVAPDLSWQPSYPSFARGPKPRPHGGLVQPPTDTNAGPLCWAPTYPDFARKAPPRPHGGLFAPPSDTNAGPLTWAPSYPDFAKGPRPRPHGGLTEPPSDTTPAPLTWQPIYPDFARTARRNPFGGLFQPPWDTNAGALCWAPTYPDFARAARRPLNVGGLVQPPTDTNTGPLTWAPSYPDFARAARRNPFGGLTQPPSDTNGGPLTWSPVYPDFARKAPPRPHGGHVAPPSDTNAGALCWAPTFADFARGPRRPVNQGGMVTTWDTSHDPRTWAPSYPDFARGALRPLNVGGQAALYAFPLPNPDAPFASWQPSYPDFARAARRPLNVGGAFQFSPRPIPVPDQWAPVYPDRIHRRTMITLPVIVAPLDFTPPVPTQWAPSYPDQIRRGWRPLGLLVGPLTDTNAGPRTWAPTFPDFARGGRRNPLGGITEVPSAFDRDLLWSAAYPDRVPAARRNPFGGLVEPPSDTNAGPLCWSPVYPDFARRPRLLWPVGGSVLPELPQPDPAPDLSWQPIYPDFARGPAPRPHGGHAGAPIGAIEYPVIPSDLTDIVGTLGLVTWSATLDEVPWVGAFVLMENTGDLE